MRCARHGARPGAPEPPAGVWSPGGFWAHRLFPVRLLAGLLLALAGPGCGGAHAPCPTPTANLDGLRDDTERLDERVGQARAAERAEKQRRDSEGRRTVAAQAVLDSIAAATGSRK